MIIGRDLGDALNKQANYEIYSAQVYYALALYAEGQHYNGFAAFFYQKANEEGGHAKEFFKHLLDRNYNVRLEALAAPKHDFTSIAQLFELALAHEGVVTEKINTLNDIAQRTKDYNALQFLQHMANEQIEEEADAMENLTRINLVKNDPAGLLALDKEFGA